MVETSQLEYFIFDHDKFLFGRSGKQRSKLEARARTNRHDPSGHSRKLATKLRNTERNHDGSDGTKKQSKALRKQQKKQQRFVTYY